MSWSFRFKHLAHVCLVITPYLIAFVFNQSMIADIFSLVLFALTIYLLKTPIRVLRTLYKVKGTEDVAKGVKNSRWKAWWLSPSIFGSTSYLYFLLVRNGVLVFPDMIGLPHLRTMFVLIFWWAIILASFTILMELCWREYLRNVFQIGNAAMKAASISFLRWTKTQNFLIEELSAASFQTYERVIFSFSMVLGLFAFLSSIFFVGGDIILDSLILALAVYALLFDPTGPFHDFEKLFYNRLLSDIRNRHRSSFMITLLILMGLVGEKLLFPEELETLPFLVALVSFSLGISVFFLKSKLERISKILPLLGFIWLFLTDYFGNQNLASALGIGIVPIAWYLWYSMLHIGLKDVRRSTPGRMLAYIALFALTGLISSLSFFIVSQSFLIFGFFAFALSIALHVSRKGVESRRALIQIRFKESVIRAERKISIASLFILLALVSAYSYYFIFLGIQQLLSFSYTIDSLWLLRDVFLKLVIFIFAFPFILVGYFFLFSPYSRYILTDRNLVCHMGIVLERIPLNTITSLEVETKYKRIRRVPFILRFGTVVNHYGPNTWSAKIKNKRLVIFASEDLNRNLKELSRRPFKQTST